MKYNITTMVCYLWKIFRYVSIYKQMIIFNKNMFNYFPCMDFYLRGAEPFIAPFDNSQSVKAVNLYTSV